MAVPEDATALAGLLALAAAASRFGGWAVLLPAPLAGPLVTGARARSSEQATKASRQQASAAACAAQRPGPTVVTRARRPRSRPLASVERALRVPVGEVHAAIGFFAAQALGARGAVDAPVRLAQAQPHVAHRVVRPRRDLGLRRARPGVLEQRRVVGERWVGHFVGDLHAAHGQRVERAADADRKTGQDGLVGGQHEQCAIRLVDTYRSRLARHRGRATGRLASGSADVGDDDLGARFEFAAPVELVEQLRAHVEALGECLVDALVGEHLQLGALHHVGRHAGVGTGRIGGADLVDAEQRRAVGLQGVPGAGIDLAARRQAARGLEGGDGAPHVGAEAAIDLAGRKPGPVHQDLRLHHRRALAARGQHRAAGGAVEARGLIGWCRCGLRRRPHWRMAARGGRGIQR